MLLYEGFGSAEVFFSIKVARSPQDIYLCQQKYALDIISEVGLLGARPVSFPIEQNHNLAMAKGDILHNPESYRCLIDRLIYLFITRPELSYCVHALAQFMQQPRIAHWEAVRCE